MSLRLLIAGLAAMPLLAACETTTPYSPAAQGYYGYHETQVESNRWLVTFSGNSVTDLKTVETYLLYRAAEITRQNGSDYFVIVNRNVDESRDFQSTGLYPHRHAFSMSFYDPRFGWRRTYDPFYDPFFDDFSVQEITRYEATAEIVLGKGAKPAGDVNAYDAEDVLINLSGQIQRAEPQ